MKKKRKSRRTGKVMFNVWLPRDEKQRLAQISAKTGIDQSKLARRAFGMLYEAYNRGQLELGFPDTTTQTGFGASQ